jgi:DNA-directed RNA polymerase subunit N (RpoN/RPB10)
MIIPVKCFTCGKVLADKHEWYMTQVRERKIQKGEIGCNINSTNTVSYLDITNVEKTIEGKVMDELCLTKMCCRRHMLTHVNIE